MHWRSEHCLSLLALGCAPAAEQAPAPAGPAPTAAAPPAPPRITLHRSDAAAPWPSAAEAEAARPPRGEAERIPSRLPSLDQAAEQLQQQLQLWRQRASARAGEAPQTPSLCAAELAQVEEALLLRCPAPVEWIAGSPSMFVGGVAVVAMDGQMRGSCLSVSPTDCLPLGPLDPADAAWTLGPREEREPSR